MIDFHSHILPGIDDGAADCNESIKLLEMCKKKGINNIVLTSHCYPHSSKDIIEFLEKRERALDELKEEAVKRGIALPEFSLGCEVHLSSDVSRISALRKLCIEDTNYMLLEMPTSSWSDRVVDYVYKICLRGITPIIAHDERNFAQKEEMRNLLYNLDILIQANASSFGMAQFKKYFDNMFKQGMIHVIGSDMHNCTTRPNDMDKAKRYISKRYGDECFSYLMNNANTILSGDDFSYRNMKSFKKKSLFGR